MADRSRTGGTPRLLDPARVLLEYSTEAAYIAEVEGPLVWFAPSVANILGREPQDLLGRRLRDLVASEDREKGIRWRDLLMESQAGSEAVTTEPLRYARGDGSTVWCTVTARLVFDDEGTAIGITGALRDVDDLIRSRDLVSRANRQLHEALDAQEDPWVTAVAVRDEQGEVTDFRFEEVNRAAAEFHRLVREDMTGRTFREVYGVDEAAADVSGGASVLATGQPLVLNDQWSSVSKAHGRADTWLDIRITAVGHDRVLYTWRDVSQRYEAQASLAEALDLLRAIMDANTDPWATLAAVRDGDGVVRDFRFKELSASAAAFIGLDAVNSGGQTLLGSVGEAGPEDVAWCAGVLATGEPALINNSWSTIAAMNGRAPAYLDIRISRVDDDHVFFTWRDVTERHRAQAALADALDLLRSVMDSQVDPHAILRVVRDEHNAVVDFAYEDCNAAAAEFEGMSRDDLIGRPLKDVMPSPQSAADSIRDCASVLATGEPVIINDLRTAYVRADGMPIVCDTRIVSIDDERVSFSWRDVTERFVDRESVASALRLLRAVMDAQIEPHAILRAVRDADGTVIDFVFEDCNPAAAEFEGRTREELVGRTLREVAPTAAEGEVDVADCRLVLESGRPTIQNEVVTQYLRPDGRPIVTDGRIVPVDPDTVSYVWRDVTDRYLAQESLADAFGLLRAVLDAQIEPHAILRAVRDADDVAVDFVYEDCNEAAVLFEQRTRDALVGRSLWDTCATPQDAAYDIRICASVLASGEPTIQNDVATGYIRADGRPIMVDLRIVPVDRDRVSYTWRDVTDRYEDERRLRESEERFRLLTEASSDVVYLAGLDGRITWVAPTIIRSLGWRPANWLGHLPGEFFHPEDGLGTSDDAGMRDARPAAPGRPDARRIRTAQGSYRWMAVRHTPLHDSDGRLLGVSGSMKDVDQLVQAQLEILEAHNTLRTVMDNQVDPHEILEAVRDEGGVIVDFVVVDFNRAAEEFEGRSGESLLGKRLTEFYRSQKDAADDIAFCAEAITTGRPVTINDEPSEAVDAQGRPLRLDIRIVSIGGDRVSYVWRDVTDRYESQQRLAESEARFRLLAENMSDVVVLVTNGIVEWVSPSIERVLGWPVDELLGKPPTDIVHPDDLGPVTASWQSVSEGVLPRIRFRAKENSGVTHWLEASGTVMTTQGERRVVLGASVVDAEVEARSRLERMASQDELTGLINRHAVFELLDRVVAGGHRQGRELAVLFCDLDGFKSVNDDFGHAAGDALLRTVAARVQEAVRGGDVVARIGGDELLVVLQGVRDLDDAIRVAEKVRSAISLPVEVPGGVARVSCSIGVGLAQPGQSVDDLVADADRAMYNAKRSGKDAVVAVRSD